MQPPANHPRGFSLIELLIVLGIASLLLAVGVPAMKYLTDTNKIRSASYSILANINFARNEAIKRNSEVSIIPDSEWNNGWNISADSTKLRTQQNINTVEIASTNSTITYDQDGRLTSGGTVTFTVDITNSPAVKRCVTVELSGHASIQQDKDDDGDCDNG